MISDDSDAIRQVLKDILEIGKHNVVGESIDGEETVARYDEISPDLLLLDLAMPKKDGRTVTNEIISAHPDAKIIIITASDNQEVIQDCLNAGAIAHIAKPFAFDNVLKVITKILVD